MTDPKRTRRTDRNLSDSDLALWAHVRAGITPITRKRITHSKKPLPKPHLHGRSGHTTHMGLLLNTNPLSHHKSPPSDDTRGLMRGIRRAIARGGLCPEASIDLHGMHVAQAQSTLGHFVQNAAAQGYRVVLVITGKGSTNPQENSETAHPPGIIKRSFSQWIAAPSLAPLVSHYCTAHPKHGGEGAFYVFLRKHEAPHRYITRGEG